MTTSPRPAGRHLRFAALLERLDARRGAVEQHPAIDVIRQKHRRFLGYPCRLGDLGHLGQDLGAGVAAAHDDDALVGERLRRLVGAGMDLDALEHLPAGIIRDVGAPPCPGHADDHAGRPVAPVGGNSQKAILRMVDRAHRHRPADGQVVASLIAGEVIEHVVPAGIGVLVSAHQPARQR